MNLGHQYLYIYACRLVNLHAWVNSSASSAVHDNFSGFSLRSS